MIVIILVATTVLVASCVASYARARRHGLGAAWLRGFRRGWRS